MIKIGTTCSLALMASALPCQTGGALPEVNVERIHSHLEFLADDLLEGRDTGQAGYEVAARYVAAHFRQLGLEPAGTDGYMQPIEFVSMRRDPAGAAVVVHHPGGMTELERGPDFVEGTSPFSEEVQISAPLVFVGHGVYAPEDGVDDFAGLELEGKIALVLSGAPPTLASEKRAHFSSNSTKRQQLVERGAVGAMSIRTLTDRKRYKWERVIDRADQPSMVWRRGETYPPSLSPQLQAQVRLSASGATKLFEHAPVALDTILQAAETGPVAGFDFADVKVTLATRSRHEVITSPNVVAVLRGADSELADEYVVYSGHLDHVGRGKPEDGDDIYNGYYDNAMGIALMMEAAEVMASAQRPARSVMFLAVTGEEKGLLGSEYFAHYPTVPSDSIIANVNIDMPVLMYPLADLIAFGAENSTLEAVAEKAAIQAGLTMSPDPMPEEVLFVRSDQYSFVKQGVPAIYLKPGINSSDPGVDGAEVTETFRKQHYHRPSDQLGLPVDDSAIAKFAQVNILIGEAIANAPERPRWHAGNFFGEQFANQPEVKTEASVNP